MHQMNIKAWGLILVCLLFGSLSAGAVTAQDDCPNFTESIGYGDEVQGEINDDAVFIFYCFQGERGDELVIDLETTDGDLDPYLLLSDINVEEFFAENDNASSRDENAHIEYTLEDDATYILTVTRVDGNNGRTDGEFSLRLESDSASSSTSSSSSRSIEGGQCSPGSNLLIPGYNLESTINDDNFLRSYCFYGVAGVEYRMTVETLSDDLDPLVFVTTPDLAEIIDSNDNVNSRSTDARLDFVPEEDGVYLIGVTRFDLDAGETAGDFVISLENRTTDEAEACPDALRFPEDGIEIPRAEETFLYVYCFNGSEDDEVSFRAEAQRGDLDMAVFITAPNLDTVEQGEGKDESLELSATIPEDGPYLVIVFDLTGLGRIDMTFEGGSSSGNSSSNGNSALDTIVTNNGSSSSGSNNSGDCDEEPLSFLVEGSWSSTSSTGTMEMKFDCDGNVNVTLNGNSFEAPYTFEDETLTLELDDGDLVVEGVLLTRTALIGTSEGQAFMLLNRAR